MNIAPSTPIALQTMIQDTAASARLPAPLSETGRRMLIERVKRLLKEQDAALVAHYYTDADLQWLAEETGGCVSDSLEMARFGHRHPGKTLVVAGVRFMGETAKILSPEKRILMPDLEANCSLDLGCPSGAFGEFCDQHPERTVVVYTNTSVEVKARADWVVTSGIALDIAAHLAARGEKVLWAPDKHLGRYVQKVTGADMLMWDGSCIVHDAFKTDALKALMDSHPDAAVLVHPESPESVIDLADVVGSTSVLIKAVRQLNANTFIVATDRGIFYKMRQAAPDKTFLEAPNGGVGATCQSCAHCPWMAMNGLQNLADVLESGANEIHIDEEIRRKALVSTSRMLDFAAERGVNRAGRGHA